MNNPFQKYPHYKPSGVQWLGDIPQHWEVQRLKHLFQEKKKQHDVTLNCGSISFGEVVTKDDERIPLETKKSYQVLNKGEFLLNPLNLNYDLKSLRIGLSRIDVVVSSGYIILQLIRGFDRQYFKWLLHIYDVNYMKLLGSGVRQTINFKDIADSILSLPPLPEQTAIAQFLDRKTAQIEVAIAQKQRMIELLKERRQILIHQAVTRGLNPDVPMKDSGVEWIGKIPEYWAISKLGFYTTSIQTGPFGSQLHSHDYIENGVPVINPSHIIGGEIIPDNTQTINPLKHQELKHHTLNVGDIIFGRRGEMGRCAMVRPDDKVMICGTGSIKLSLDKSRIYPEYLNHYLKIGVVKDWFSLNSVGSTMENLNSSILSTVPILIPSITEQIIISKHIETATQKIDKAIGLKEQEIEKLKEYKASLINSVVTGKVKVTENPEGVS